MRGLGRRQAFELRPAAAVRGGSLCRPRRRALTCRGDAPACRSRLMPPDRPRPGLAARLTLALVLAFAALAAGRSARYGVHEDSALSYSIALRHLAGQLPYRAYLVPP